MERDFKGIWIPKEIWLNKDLSLQEKLFLVEIDSLDNEDGCFASNGHFADFFGLSKNRCSEVINSLERKDLLKIKMVRTGKKIDKRVIRVTYSESRIPYSESRQTYSESRIPYSESRQTYSESRQTYSGNSEGNNTFNNTIRESHALDFLQKNYPIRFESEIMKVKSEIKDWKKFCLDFNDTVDGENLFYSDKVLFARFGKYSRNWIQNQEKFSGNEENAKPVYHRKIS